MLIKNETKKILIIYDALEMFRQPHADVQNHIEEVLQELFNKAQTYTSYFYHGKKAEDTLEHLNDSDFDLVVFLSNSIIRRDSRLYKILEENKSELERFVKKGRSIVFFHQGFVGEKSTVDFLDFMTAENWISVNKNEIIDFSINQEHSILQFPYKLDKEHFNKIIKESSFYLAYYAVKTEEFSIHSRASKVIEIDNQNALALMTYENKGRVVLSSYPADWIKDKKTLVNIFYYALFGVPRIISVEEKNILNENYFNMLYTRISGVNDIIRFTDVDNLDKNGKFNFLAKNGKLFIFTSEELKDKYLGLPSIQKALKNGAKLTVVKLTHKENLLYEELNYTIGRLGLKKDQVIFQNILSDIVIEKWVEKSLIHDVKDLILTISDFLENQDHSTREQMYPLKNEIYKHVYNRTTNWLKNNEINKDPITGVLALWLLKVVKPQEKLDEKTSSTLKNFSEDKRCTDIFLVINQLLKGSIKKHLKERINNIEDSLGSLVRLLEDIYLTKMVNPKFLLNNEEISLIYYEIDSQIRKNQKFFDNNLSGINSSTIILRFLLDIPSDFPIKENANLLINYFISYISNVASKAKKNLYKNIQEKDSNMISIESIVVLTEIGISSKVEMFYPTGLFKTVVGNQDLDTKQSDYEETIEMLSIRVNQKNDKIVKLLNELSSVKNETTQQIKRLNISAFVGTIAIYLALITLIILDVYYAIKIMLDFEEGMKQYLTILIALVTVTISAITLIIKTKLYRFPMIKDKKLDN